MPQAIDSSLASQSASGHERAGSEFWARNARRSGTANTVFALPSAGKLVTAEKPLRKTLSGFRAIPKYVGLLQLAAGPERPDLAAAEHSEKTAAFPRLQDGPIEGMTF
jgi:hypothetical protein